MIKLNVDISDIHGDKELTISKWPQIIQPTRIDMSEMIFDLLLNNGMPEATAFLTAQHVNMLAVDRAYSIAGDVVGHIMRSLGDSAAGRALERVVCGDGDESLREVARRSGCSHQAIMKQEKAARAKLRLPPKH